MKNIYVYVIEYDGRISMEGYSSEDKAIKHLEQQGYRQIIGWQYADDCNNLAKIKEIKII